MSQKSTPIYHITDVENLAAILRAKGLRSDSAMADRPHTVIGYEHIKHRRMKETRVPCCNNRFVGEFVPFYYCPRSPMLFVINKGSTGRPAGCQKTIIHLMSTVGTALTSPGEWAISDGNAGASYPSFYGDLDQGFAAIDWNAVRATDWRGITNQKSAEFLVADFFPWKAISHVGCHNSTVAREVENLLIGVTHRPHVSVERGWYY
jgi:hypothetical protein